MTPPGYQALFLIQSSRASIPSRHSHTETAMVYQFGLVAAGCSNTPAHPFVL